MDFCPVCDRQILPQRSTTVSPQGKQRILISQAPTPLYCSPACRDSDSPPCSPTTTSLAPPSIAITSSARRHSSALLTPNYNNTTGNNSHRRPGVSPGPSVDRLTSTSAPSAAALLTFARAARPQPTPTQQPPIISTSSRHRRSSSSSEASSSRTRSRSSSRTSLSSVPPASPPLAAKEAGGDYSCETCLDDLDLEDSDVPTGLVLPATYRTRHSHSRAKQKKADEKRAKSVRGEWEEGWKAYERRLRGGVPSPTTTSTSTSPTPASPKSTTSKSRKHLAPTPATTTTTTTTLPAQPSTGSRAWSWETLPPERRTNTPALYPVLTLPPQRVKRVTKVFVPTSASSSSSDGRWEEREVEEEVPVDRKRLFYFNAD